jgi:tetratricopeptide (TPR) repeat protein
MVMRFATAAPSTSRWDHRPGGVVAVCTLWGCLFLAAVPGLASAQNAAYASTGVEAGQLLAKKALLCLRRGEDGVTTEARLAAYREGLDLARRAVAADDHNADGHFAIFANYGRILLLEGTTPNPLNLLKVNRELDRALEIDPNHADALASKGGLYRQLPRLLGGSDQKAERCLTRAIELDPSAVGARVELAQLYRDRGETQRGIPLLKRAAEVAERDGKFRQLTEAQDLLREFTAQ